MQYSYFLWLAEYANDIPSQNWKFTVQELQREVRWGMPGVIGLPRHRRPVVCDGESEGGYDRADCSFYRTYLTQQASSSTASIISCCGSTRGFSASHSGSGLAAAAHSARQKSSAAPTQIAPKTSSVVVIFNCRMHQAMSVPLPDLQICIGHQENPG